MLIYSTTVESLFRISNKHRVSVALFLVVLFCDPPSKYSFGEKVNSL